MAQIDIARIRMALFVVVLAQFSQVYINARQTPFERMLEFWRVLIRAPSET